MSQSVVPAVRRVVLRDYKSIRECDVSLGPLAILVGPNGSGKSNFLDALRFVSDSLRTSVNTAVADRGEVLELLRRTRERATTFSIELSLAVPEGEAQYQLTIGEVYRLFVIETEACWVSTRGAGREGYRVRNGRIEEATIQNPPPASDHELYLRSVATYPQFQAVRDLLHGMRFYHIDPAKVRIDASQGQPARELASDGQGSLFAYHRLQANPEAKQRLEAYLRAILPSLREIKVATDRMDVGLLHGTSIRKGTQPAEREEPTSLTFVINDDGHRLAFRPRSISDGTLRAFGVLLALFQSHGRGPSEPISLVGIEEPELTLHPAAAGVLFDALTEASQLTQILVTTHSAELLDIKELDPDALLVVDAPQGETRIGPADDASLSAMRNRMYTAGELMEMNQLLPQPRPTGGSPAPAAGAP